MAVHRNRQPRALTILSWNANSINNKKEEFVEAFRTHQIDVALVSETYLKPGKKLNLTNLAVYRNDRIGSQGGGTAIVVRRDLDHYEVDLPALTSLEANAVVVKMASGKLRLISAYKPPKTALQTADLDALLRDQTPTLLAGDLNSKHTSWNSRNSNRDGRLLHEHSASRAYSVLGPTAPTFYPASQHRPDVLDIAIPMNVTKSISINALQELSSDHNPVLISYGDEAVEIDVEPKLNTKKTDWKLFRTLMDRRLTDASPPINTSEDIDRCTKELTEGITDALMASTPTAKPRRNGEFDLPLHITKSIQAKNKVRKLWQKHRLPSLKTKLNSMVTDIKNMIKNHLNAKWTQKLESLKTEDQSLWQLTKRLMRIPTKSPPLHGMYGLAYSNQEKANALADTLESTFTPHDDPSDIDKIRQAENQIRRFKHLESDLEEVIQTTPAEIRQALDKLKTRKAPGLDQIPNAALKELSKKSVTFMAHIFNAILRWGHFPSLFKESKIIVFQKPGKDAQFPQNYRPISLLSGVSKILEKIILARINLFLETNHIIQDEQFGFRPKHSANHQVLRITEYVVKGFNDNKTTAAVFLDVAQAFDRVWHEGLLSKMMTTKMPVYIIKLVASYLRRRSFRVHHQGAYSTTRPIEAGVPQGSLLAPTLFAIYIHDMPRSPNVMLGVYADDTALVAQSWHGLQACKYLQAALDNYESWCQDWRIKINVAKSNAVLFTRKRTAKATTVCDLELFEETIPWKKEAKYLGVTLDKTLSWQANTRQLATKARSRLGILDPVLNRKSTLSIANGLTLYKTMVLPIITYAAPIWATAAKSQILQLQRVQNRALRTATRSPWFVRNDDIHRDAGIQTIRAAVIKMAEKFFEAMKAVPNVLVSSLSQYEPEDILRYKRPRNILAI